MRASLFFGAAHLSAAASTCGGVHDAFRARLRHCKPVVHIPEESPKDIQNSGLYKDVTYDGRAAGMSEDDIRVVFETPDSSIRWSLPQCGKPGNYTLQLRYALGAPFDAFAEIHVIDLDRAHDDLMLAVLPISLPSTGDWETSLWTNAVRMELRQPVDKLAVELFTPFAYPNREAKVEQRQPILGDYASVRVDELSMERTCTFESHALHAQFGGRTKREGSGLAPHHVVKMLPGSSVTFEVGHCGEEKMRHELWVQHAFLSNGVVVNVTTGGSEQQQEYSLRAGVGGFGYRLPPLLTEPRTTTWRWALPIELDLSERTRISVHYPETEAARHNIARGPWLLDLVSVRPAGCDLCQAIVFDTIFVNLEATMRIVDGNIWRGKSSEHPNINNSNVTDLPTPPMEGEVDRVMLFWCIDRPRHRYWAKALGMPLAVLERHCFDLFNAHGDEVQWLLQTYRREGGIAQLFFKPLVSKLCGAAVGQCAVDPHGQPTSVWPLEKFIELCTPRWSEEMCLDRYDDSIPPGYFPSGVHWWTALNEGEMPPLQRELQKNPFFQEPATQESYARAMEEFRRDRRPLPPLHPEFRVAYLVQTDDALSMPFVYRAMISNHSVLLVTAFRGRRPGAVFFPNSTISDGRNNIFLALRAQERRQGWRYHYFVFCDADVTFMRAGFPDFEEWLRRYEPAVGVPAQFWQHPRFPEWIDPEAAYAIYHPDHQVIAYHWEAVAELWPLDQRWDHTCWWTSQWLQSCWAAIKYKHHVLVSKTVVIANPAHGDYPKWNHTYWFGLATDDLRLQLPPGTEHCARVEPDTPHGWPWGSARMKGSRRYTPWSVDQLGPDCETNERPY